MNEATPFEDREGEHRTICLQALQLGPSDYEAVMNVSDVVCDFLIVPFTKLAQWGILHTQNNELLQAREYLERAISINGTAISAHGFISHIYAAFEQQSYSFNCFNKTIISVWATLAEQPQKSTISSRSETPKTNLSTLK